MVPMTIDWGEAGLLAGQGFGTVFLILVILAVATWLVGLIFQRTKRKKEEAKAAAAAEQTKTQS